ncbi:MAG TPA: hypothetical protein QF646_07150 [Candidatus Poseidoniales archaeon]|nr:hypothetical protein [Candidatus Poseidoniales archaeon]
MASALRLMAWLTFFGSAYGYFIFIDQSNATSLAYGLIGLALLSLIIALRPGKPKSPQRRKTSSSISSSAKSRNIPAPVLSAESAADSAERKENLIDGAESPTDSGETSVDDDQQDDLSLEDEPEVIDEELVEAIHLAEEEEEESIQTSIDARLERNAVIRERVEKRRRTRVSQLRGNEVHQRQMEDAPNEDLNALVGSGSNDLEVIAEPLHLDPGRIAASTLVRIDGQRILKVRQPVDSLQFRRPGESVAEDPPILDEAELGDLPPPPAPDSASGRLAALRDERSSDI